MFCTECICHECPYGLKCYVCNRELNDHIHICEGCHGDRVSDTCLLDNMAPEHADALRELIKARDADAIEAYFDPKTGPWYNKEGK